MRVLVTGGSGTVGAGLIAELRARGHHVVSCDVQHQPDEIGFSLGTDVDEKRLSSVMLPRLLYVGDVPVEASYHGSALLHRLLSDYPHEKLTVIETATKSEPG